MLYTETVETGTLDLIKELMRDKEFAAFNLVGGTALSLKIGHRKSIDIDLFTDSDFDSAKIANHLSEKYKAENIKTLKNGVFSLVNKVKLDILAHQYPIINKVEIVDEIRMLSLEDIGAMKLNAILYNGTRLKDFVDMHSLLEHVPLQRLTEAFEKKYPDVNKQMAHAALLYHKDVKHKHEIIFIGKKTPWKDIADRLRQAVANEHMIFQRPHIKPKQEEKLKEVQKRTLRKGHKRPRL